MDDPPGVRVAERGGHVAEDLDELARAERLVAEVVVQRAPVDVLHGHVRAAVQEREVQGADDPRVLEGGGRPRLAREALELLRRHVEERLERDAAVEAEVVGEVDDARAAAAELAQDHERAGPARGVAGGLLDVGRQTFARGELLQGPAPGRD